MSPSRRLTPGHFVTGMFAALDEGYYDISLTDLCHKLGVTTGSFYSHFGDMRELHEAVIEIWRRERAAALPDTSGDGIHDPLVILREIREAAGKAAGRDSAMRRWASSAKSPEYDVPDRAPAWARSAKAAARAVAEVDQIIVAQLTRALTDLGFADREPADLARWLAAALQVPARARDGKGFETVLDVWIRAEAFSPEGPAVTSTPAGTDAIMLYTTARTLSDAQRRALTDVARLLAAGRSTGEDPPGQDRAEAGQR